MQAILIIAMIFLVIVASTLYTHTLTHAPAASTNPDTIIDGIFADNISRDLDSTPPAATRP